MKVWILRVWENLRSGFWFLPSLMAAGAVGLAFGTVALDERVPDEWLRGLGWAYTGGADGAAAVLQTIAGSMITIAGVVFSLTLVALSLASSQFGPRLLRNFMRDTATQLVLGTFIATFLYCLLVLRTIRRAAFANATFVPHLSVTIGVLFAIASLWVLIFFIHHVAVSIQADQLVARVGSELLQSTDRLYPHDRAPTDVGPSTDRRIDAVVPGVFDREARAVDAPSDGYLQMVDIHALMGVAQAEDTILRVERRTGEYVVSGTPLVMVWPGRLLTDDVADHIRGALVLGSQRAPTQDIEYTILQLVEAAVRALSPGVNDPFTAIAAIDRLGSALCRLAVRDSPPTAHLDGEHHLRLLTPQITFPQLMDTAFNQIRDYGRSSTAVTIRLLETLAVVATFVQRSEDRAAVQRHADMIVRATSREPLVAEDHRAIEESREAVLRILQDPAHHEIS